MYNRYIPQPDGTYRKNRIQESIEHPQPPSAQSPCSASPPPPEQCAPPAQHPCIENSHQTDATSFLRRLLPKDFDTGDLLIVLLLLLMAGDCKEDNNTALLTLALYLFM